MCIRDSLSGLATQDHNLFGMKWSSSYALCEEVAGKSSWRTGEEYGGEQVTITADFISFVGDAECIRCLLYTSRSSRRLPG